MNQFKEDLKKLSSAEDLLSYFNIEYDTHIVNVNRLHIMKRMHDYLKEYGNLDIFDNVLLYRLYKDALKQSYLDFTKSNAMQERVFKVHKDRDPANKNKIIPGCKV